MKDNTINIDVSIIYYWFDHLVLHKNGDSEKVATAIKEGDYKTFMKYYNYYNYEFNYDNKGGSIIFFPDTAAIFCGDTLIGEAYITNPDVFRMITNSEYECG